ncbi:MAG: NIPSNAP family protein [Acidimicrobiia bacterium]
MEYQVRRYRISPGEMDRFVELWREKVVPLRQRLGFTVHGAWVIEDSNDFVWIIGYEGPGGIAAGNEAYYASEERKSMSPDPAGFIVEGTHDLARRVL